MHDSEFGELYWIRKGTNRCLVEGSTAAGDWRMVPLTRGGLPQAE